MAADSVFPVDEAQIVALFMESVFYGIYLVTLAQCLRALLWSQVERKIKSDINWPMLVVALLLATFATLDEAFGLRHVLDAFIFYKGPGGAATELENISYWVNVMKTADYVAQTFIGDAMLIYRCWIVYEKDWRVIIPSIFLWIGGSTCGILLTVTFATLKTDALIDTSKAVPFVDSMIALTLSMNVITTGLIVYKIWSVRRRTHAMFSNTSTASGPGQSRLASVMMILVESAAMYTISVIIFVATYVAGNNANYGTSDNVVQIIGIAFNLIIIRVNSGNSFGSTTYKDSVTNLKAAVNSGRKRGPADTYPLSILQTRGDIEHSTGGALEIEISKQTHSLHDSQFPLDRKDGCAA